MSNTVHAVVINAASLNFGKYSSTKTEHRYSCKSIGCTYIKKYHLDNRSGSFRSYHHGVHEHVTPSDEFSPSRGLTIRQKEWVAEAMSCGEKSSGQIVGYFRHKRTLLEEDPGVPDPEKKKLSNYVQSYRKKRAATYYPSLKDLKQWCIAHGPSNDSRTNESNLNEPFVLNYSLVWNQLYLHIAIVSCFD